MKLRKAYYAIILGFVATIAYIVSADYKTTKQKASIKSSLLVSNTTSQGYSDSSKLLGEPQEFQFTNVNRVEIPTPEAGDSTLDVHIFNVGQGNCVLVKYPNGKYMIVDCGITSSGKKEKITEISAKIATIIGDSNIHTVLITHADEDHFNILDGISQQKNELATKINNPENIIIGGSFRDYKGSTYVSSFTKEKVTTFSENYSSINDGRRVEAIFPGNAVETYVLSANASGNQANHKNDSSIVLMLRWPEHAHGGGAAPAGAGGGDQLEDAYSIVLTGDATEEVENKIRSLWEGELFLFGSTKILLIGHHGSDKSTTSAFVEFIDPSIGFFSASASKYGHPRKAVYDRLDDKVYSTEEHNISYGLSNKEFETIQSSQAIFATANQGDIFFKSNNDGLIVMTEKNIDPLVASAACQEKATASTNLR